MQENRQAIRLIALESSTDLTDIDSMNMFASITTGFQKLPRTLIQIFIIIIPIQTCAFRKHIVPQTSSQQLRED